MKPVSARKPSLVLVVFVSTDTKNQLVHRFSFGARGWIIAQGIPLCCSFSSCVFCVQATKINKGLTIQVSAEWRPWSYQTSCFCKGCRASQLCRKPPTCQVKQYFHYKCFRDGLSDLVHAIAAACIWKKNSFQMSCSSDLWQYLSWRNSLDLNHIIFLLYFPHWYPLENMCCWVFFNELRQSWQISCFPFSSSTSIS